MSASKKIKHILIGGAKGVGKTTLISSPLIKVPLRPIIYSNLLKSYAKEIFKKNFIRLTLKERDILRKLVVKNIIKDKKHGIYIWEVHFCCYEFKRKRLVVPKNLLKITSGIIFLTLDPLILEKRRLNDKTKKRSYSPKIITRDSKTELEYARKVSAEFNIPLFLHENSGSQDKINEIINKIIK